MPLDSKIESARGGALIFLLNGILLDCCDSYLRGPIPRKEFPMLKLLDRVFTRILILAVLALCALGALGLFVLSESRDNLYEQKKADIRHVVEAAVAIAASGPPSHARYSPMRERNSRRPSAR